MPELSTESAFQCKEVGKFSAVVRSSDGTTDYHIIGLGSERYWPECTCPAYRFSKATTEFGGRMVKPPCRHIREVQDERSKHLTPDNGLPEENEDGKLVCPYCKGEIETAYVAV